MGSLAAVVVQPKILHSATVIFLHGLGDSGNSWKFLPTFSSGLQHVKWIFPNAPQQKVTINGGGICPSWYDILSLSNTDRTEQDEKGLLSTVAKVKDLIENEIIAHKISPEKIILGGFSQGAAVTLLTLVTSPLKIGGFVALSGYLPIADRVPSLHNSANISSRVLLCHGDHDAVVSHAWGTKSAAVLKSMGYNVSFENYPGLGHSASDEEIKSVCKFVSDILV